MFRQIGIGAAAVLTAGVLAIGCSDDGGDNIVSGSTLTTDAFPGDQIQQNNVADDQRAWSNQGQNTNNDLEVFFNRTNNNAIAMYSLAASGGTNHLLYCAFYNGSTWGNPVEIRGEDANALADVTDVPTDFHVVWINTNGNANAAIAGRTNDAVITYRQNDRDDLNLAGSNEDPNKRGWFTYFDSSAATAAAAGGVVGGFQTFAATVDDDNQVTGALNDPPVTLIAIVSESIHCAESYTGSTTDTVSGDPTDSVNIVFMKDQSSGGTAIGNRIGTKAILLDAADNDLQNLLDTQEIATPGAGSLANADAVSAAATGIRVYNDGMLWQYSTLIAGDTETLVTVTEFDADGINAQVQLGESPIDNDIADIVGLPAPENIYGPDTGRLASHYLFFTQTGFQNDQLLSDGDVSPDVDLFVAQIDDDAALAVDREKIDNFDDTIETVTFPLRTGRDVTDVRTAIGRTGEYIGVIFNQQNTDNTTDGAGVGINTNQVVWATAVQTRLIPATGTTPARDINDSVFDDVAGGFANGEQVPAQVGTGTAAAGNEANVVGSRFQDELGDGDGCDLNCIIQSNADRMNFTYRQNTDGPLNPSTSTDEERLLVNGFSVALGVLATDAPTITLESGTEQIVATRDTDVVPFTSATFDERAFDAGDQTRDATGNPAGDSGRVLVIYRLNQQNASETNVAGAFLEARLFVNDQNSAASAELLSTDGQLNFDQVGTFQGGKTVPPEATTRHHAGTTLHLLWTESVNAGPGQRLAARSYEKGAINDQATGNDSLENRFTPNLVGGTTPSSPAQVDNVTDGPLGNPAGFELLATGTTAGVYFGEDQHLFFSDTTGTANDWDATNGQPSPQIVDNDAVTGNLIVGAWEVFTRPVCNDLTGAIAVMERDNATTLGGAQRYYVRIHN